MPALVAGVDDSISVMTGRWQRSRAAGRLPPTDLVGTILPSLDITEYH